MQSSSMFWKQLYLLLWKNFILRVRHPVRTITEVLWPIFLLAILVAIRKSQEVVIRQECHYPARAMPSAGVFPWFKSILCDVQNPCFTVPVASETPGQINARLSNSSLRVNRTLNDIGSLLNENTTVFSNTTQLINDVRNLRMFAQDVASTNTTVYPVSAFMENSTAFKIFLMSNLSLSSQTVDFLLDSEVSPFQAAILPQALGQRIVVCNAVVFGMFMQSPVSGSPNISTVSSELCNLTNAQLDILSGYAVQTINATAQATSDLNTTLSTLDPEILNSLGRLASYQRELQSIRDPLSELLSAVGQGSDGSTLMASVLGFDISSPNAVNEFCGHPENKSTVISAFVSGSSGNASSNLTDFVTANVANETDTVTFCQNLIEIFENNSELQFIWDTVKPILLGKIPYSPHTPLVKSIIKEANVTFESIEFIRSVGETWRSTTGPALYRNLESGNVTTFLREFLNTTRGTNFVKTALNYTDAQVAQLRNLLSNEDNPNDNVTTWKDYFRQFDGAVRLVTKLLECVELNKFQPYETETELVQASLDLINNKTLWGGIVFLSPSNSSTYMPEVVKYKIRQDSGAVTWTNNVQRYAWKPDAYDDASSITMGYYTNGYLFLQDIVETAVAKSVAGMLIGGGGTISVSNYPGSYMQQFPYPCYTYDEFLEYLSTILSLIMTLAWIYSVCIIIKSVVYEKEQRLKEVMKMMGLSNGVHWVAWFINSFVVMFLSIILMLIVLKAGAITPFSNMFIVLLWLCSFAIATIMQCFLISCFFSRANLAAACGGILYFLFYIPYTMVVAWGSQMTLSLKLVACLLSNVAFGYGAGYISSYEMSGDGIQFSNWLSSPEPADELNFLISMIMMLVDAVIYFVLTWYIENVFPGTYGVPRKWYFFVTRSYWCGTPLKADEESDGFIPVADTHCPAMLEAEPSHLTLGVSMQKLRKVYSNGKVAVNDLSLNFYEGQITSFLGHNGAGKTTTMSMLTGLFTPTSGTARIYGKDICTNMDTIRRQLGFCPQHNVLFGDLTVWEHLELYSGLKNAKGGKKEIERMLIDVGLPHKRDDIARHLSGGMKRKLSVAVAFVGGSKCVILDEPTAGVDPYARRGIWDLLLSYRKDRTIVLSTHHMDEADLLGDRIAIISHGKLKCCGSSLFLKGCYGVGYYLTIVKDNESNSSSVAVEKIKELSAKEKDEGIGSSSVGGSSSHSSTLSLTPLSSIAESPAALSVNADETPAPPRYATPTIGDITARSHKDLVLNTIPGARVHEEDAREITFVLPYHAQSEGRYSLLFKMLDDRGTSYGLEDTSLEEIFLNVAEHSQEEPSEEKSTCCFCIPRRRSTHVSAEPSPEAQARRGLRRSHSNSSQSSVSSARALLASGDHDEGDVANSNDSLFEDGSNGAGSYRIGGKRLVLQQFLALVVKRLHHARRNRKGLIAQVIVPAVFVALALTFALIVPPRRDLPPLELQPWMYGDSYTFFSNDKPSSNLSSSVTDALLSSPGIGMRCVTNYTVTNYDNTNVECPASHNQTWSEDDSIKSRSQPINSSEMETCLCTEKATRVLLAECPNGAGGKGTPLSVSETNNPMYDMTGRDVADWMVKTTDRFIQTRYGGLSIGETYHTAWSAGEFRSVVDILQGSPLNNSVIGIENFVRTENVQVWFDNNGYHSMPTWLNVLNNAALRSLLPSHADRTKYGIVAINHPLNFTENQIDAAAFTQSATDTIVSICVIFALSFIPASFVLFLIEEKVTKAKHLQFVSGVNQFIYWVANFSWDLVNYAVPAIIVTLIFVCFQSRAWVSPSNLPCLVLLLLLYGFAITPMMYPASFYFTVPSTAYVVLTCINIFIGVNASIATFILEMLNDPVLNNVNDYLKLVFLVFPQYCLGRALIDMGINQAYADAYAAFGIDKYIYPLTFNLVGRNLMALAIEGVVFFILTLLIQYRFFIKPDCGRKKTAIPPSTSLVQDKDVVAEKCRILDGNNDDVLQIKDLTKVYRKLGSDKPLTAVDRMYVGVPKGECFGLLGVNGAGKTTTFKMLTGDTTPTAGDAFICGQSILNNIREVQQKTGYCPQFEALNSLLTGREHLEFYAKLRGVPPEDIPRVAEWGIERFGLKMYANKCAGTYSGGNKRKLSAAIAFIGSPPVVFLDEPTAGMDPMSRRFLWKRVAEAVRGGRCVVLTSHSMEECEALCTRLAIMVNGRYKCIGSPQHLKNRHGQGYTLSIRLKPEVNDAGSVQTFIDNYFPRSVLKEHHINVLLYQVPMDGIKLSYLFETMESNKSKLHIEDYSVSQTTLDEVFVSFARMQTDGLDDDVSLQSEEESSTRINSAYTAEDDGIVLQELTTIYASTMKV